MFPVVYLAVKIISIVLLAAMAQESSFNADCMKVAELKYCMVVTEEVIYEKKEG